MTTMERVQGHLDESLGYFDYHQIVGIFLQGSQNYKLDTPQSDVDTKLIVTPCFRDVATNHKPISTTHIRENNEHIDFKDIRLYMDTFRKQNLNFLEILFTTYKIVNDEYAHEWSRLVEARERIARMNPYRAVKSMKGVAEEKFFSMEHDYPSKKEVLAKYGYDPKQLHHLRRVEDYLARYINGERYEECLNPKSFREELLATKMGIYSLDEARLLANDSITHVREMADKFCTSNPCVEDKEVVELLEDVQYKIMLISMKKELTQL